ncbi:hypothetical protein EGH21_09425 [Halomicroarcula sp. F13]|uniref:Uncharacterized protein n=1 Tax=Haloarcula rubra TaxID=2487747 RepID=A0AAW4PSV8_9EURY|nr:hypothetical protein [Halomicroarcula rubra]MBX0323249.1 hypothetical protein [Halomicroarcula rubra]
MTTEPLDIGVLGYRSTATFFRLGSPAATTRRKNVGEKGRSLTLFARGTGETSA